MNRLKILKENGHMIPVIMPWLFLGAPGSEPDSEALEELNKKGYLMLGLTGTRQVKVPKGMFEGQGHSLSDDPACPDKVADLAIDFFK